MVSGIFKYLSAHLKQFHSTLVCRGTPVEKHWSKLWDYLVSEKLELELRIGREVRFDKK
jgi:hypothetical protein